MIELQKRRGYVKCGYPSPYPGETLCSRLRGHGGEIHSHMNIAWRTRYRIERVPTSEPVHIWAVFKWRLLRPDERYQLVFHTFEQAVFAMDLEIRRYTTEHAHQKDRPQ